MFKPLVPLMWVCLYTQDPWYKLNTIVHVKAVVLERFLPVTAGVINYRRDHHCLLFFMSTRAHLNAKGRFFLEKTHSASNVS